MRVLFQHYFLHRFLQCFVFCSALGLIGCKIDNGLTKATPLCKPFRLISSDQMLNQALEKILRGKCESPAVDPSRFQLEMTLSDESLDYKKNIDRSLLGLTFPIRISTSASVTLKIHAKTQAVISHRGEVGLWAIAPPIAGLLATVIGTGWNDYRLPTRLRQDCLNHNANACEDYEAFLISALLPMRERIITALKEEP